ncbi:MAG: choice-of-anchor D domain-containing protein, partial [Candidatus Korobacteraceae bacterium]
MALLLPILVGELCAQPAHLSSAGITLGQGSGYNHAGGAALDGSGNLFVASGNSQRVEASSGAVNFGTLALGQTSATVSLIFTFDSGATLGIPVALTQGVADLDFAIASTSTCAPGTSYSAGETCTMEVAFTPRFAGPRNGAIVLRDGSGRAIAIAYVSGGGAAPLVNFPPGSQITLPISGLAPRGIAVDGSGSVYIAGDTDNEVLKETLSKGSYLQSAIGSGLSAPMGVAVDAGGNVYIADSGNDRMLKETLSAGGYTQSTIGSGLYSPSAVAGDASGNVYIADTGNGRLLKETLSAGGYAQSTIASALNNPGGVAVDSNGIVYIADTLNDQVLKETPSAGSYTQSTVVNSGLYNPNGVAVDAIGDVYISDSGNNRLLKETPSGGGYTQGTIGSGLSFPLGVAVDGVGNVYISDEGNSRILKEDFAAPPALSFASTDVGSTSSDSPRTVTVENVGTAALVFPVPNTGNNPGIAPGFILNSSAESACPLVSAGASTAATLPAGASCLLLVSFSPLASGTDNGSLVLTDNNLNVTNATQSIALTGTGVPLGAQSQTINFPNPGAQVYGATPIVLEATATSALPVTYQVTSGPATLNGSTLTLTGTGSVTVEATQAGNANYDAATPVSRTFTVTKAPLTVTANNAARLYGAATPTFAYTITGFVNGDSAGVVS